MLFGGWTDDIITLISFMGFDLLTGLIVAGVFHKSNKTESGALESNAGTKGLCRKCGILLFVLIAHRLDIAMGTQYIRSAVVIAFTVNETISICENLGLMGLPMPKAIKKAIEVLKREEENK